MATDAEPRPRTRRPRRPAPVVLRRVPYTMYCRLRDIRANDRVRMDYLDGTLILMSPGDQPNSPGELFSLLVRAVASASGIRVKGCGSVTLRRPDPDDDQKGAGKEPDSAFFLGDNQRHMARRDDLDLTIDPAPDIAVEIYHTRDSTKALPIYARLLVPEVWQYRTKTGATRFLRLEGATYREVDRSVALPRMTPALIREALDHYYAHDLDDMEWIDWLRAWAAALPES